MTTPCKTVGHSETVGRRLGGERTLAAQADGASVSGVEGAAEVAASPPPSWSAILSFGAAHPSGRTIVRIGGQHLLVGERLSAALRHLCVTDPPIERAQTVACLALVLPLDQARALAEQLGSLASSVPTTTSLWQSWQRGMVRVPLWRPPSALARRLQGKPLSPALLLLWATMVLGALVSIWVGSLPSVQSPPTEWPILWFLLTLTTIAHEAGHVLVAAHFGVPTTTVGVALFYLFPAGYADVSQAWLAPRRARVAIALGGALGQSFPLALGYVLWRLGGEPLWGTYCLLNLGTLAFNMLPFVRMDGYWVLCHAIEVPNLRQHAFQQLRSYWPMGGRVGVWRGDAGVLAAVFALLSALFTIGMYGSALVWAHTILPEPLGGVVPCLVAGAQAAPFARRLIKAQKGRSRD